MQQQKEQTNKSTNNNNNKLGEINFELVRKKYRNIRQRQGPERNPFPFIAAEHLLRADLIQ